MLLHPAPYAILAVEQWSALSVWLAILYLFPTIPAFPVEISIVMIAARLPMSVSIVQHTTLSIQLLTHALFVTHPVRNAVSLMYQHALAVMQPIIDNL